MEIGDILPLSVEERLQIVEDIWDSIASDLDSVEVTSAQKTELDRRIAELEADPESGQDWDEVCKELHHDR